MFERHLKFCMRGIGFVGNSHGELGGGGRTFSSVPQALYPFKGKYEY